MARRRISSVRTTTSRTLIRTELLANVPDQPSDDALAADPLLHRFVVIFDREGAGAERSFFAFFQRI